MFSHSEEGGNFGRLWKVSSPLMLSFLATFLMMFVDRLFLANYSLEAHNAAAIAGLTAWTFTFGFQCLTEMSSVFVAQYNGAEKYEKLGQPVWQMLWLSAGSILLFVPLSFSGGSWFFDPTLPGYEAKNAYFFWMSFAGPMMGALGALTAFFVGQGRTRVVTVVSLLGNLVNVVLDPLFIFGVPGICKPMGAEGAAIATVLGITVQVCVFAFLFLKQESRERYGTADSRLRLGILWSCVCVAAPTAGFEVLECGGWAFYYSLMAKVSSIHVLVAALCQNFVFLLLFFGFGVHKGLASLVGNLIGAKKQGQIPSFVRVAILMNAAFVLVCLGVLLIFPDSLTGLFLSHSEETGEIAKLADPNALIRTAQFCLLMTCIYLFLDFIRLTYASVLAASGDTRFLMLSGGVSIWLFHLLPTYILVVKMGGSVELSSMIWLVYGFFHALLIFIRYRSEKWNRISLIEKEEIQLAHS